MIINKISIIVPAYNEAATISIVIDKLLNLTFINNIKKEIIIVNYCFIHHTENLIHNIIIMYIIKKKIFKLQQSINIYIYINNVRSKK